MYTLELILHLRSITEEEFDLVKNNKILFSVVMVLSFVVLVLIAAELILDSQL